MQDVYFHYVLGLQFDDIMWWYIGVSGLIAIAGTICNGLIMISVIKYRILRKKSYTVVVSLAMCDMFKVVVILNLMIYSLIDDLYDVCVATSTLGVTLLCVTTFHLAAESINRCLIILHPFRYLQFMKKKYVALCVFFIWLMPCLITIAFPAISSKDSWIEALRFHSHMYGCIADFEDDEEDEDHSAVNGEVYVITYALMFALPLIIMIIAYVVILKIAYRNAGKMRNIKVSLEKELESHVITKTRYRGPIISMVASSYDTAAVSSTSENFVIPVEIKHQPRQSTSNKIYEKLLKNIKNRKRELKASRTVLMIITAFIICNAPIFSVSWYDVVHGKTTDMNIQYILTCFAFLQVIIDPVIYFLRLKDYKNARKKWKNVGQSMIRKTIRRISFH